jgi:hypothetical protein
VVGHKGCDQPKRLYRLPWKRSRKFRQTISSGGYMDRSDKARLGSTCKMIGKFPLYSTYLVYHVTQIESIIAYSARNVKCVTLHSQWQLFMDC